MNMEGLDGLMEQAPGAAAVIIMAYLFLRDRKELQNQHYQTITTLFAKADKTAEEVLIQLKESTAIISQAMLVNQQVSDMLVKVNESLEKERDSDTKIDSNEIKRALKEIERQRERVQ